MAWNSYGHSHKSCTQLYRDEEKKGRICDVCGKDAEYHCTKNKNGFFFCFHHMAEFMGYDRSIAMMKRDDRIRGVKWQK